MYIKPQGCIGCTVGRVGPVSWSLHPAADHYLISSPSGERYTINLTPWCSWCFIRLIHNPSYQLTGCTFQTRCDDYWATRRGYADQTVETSVVEIARGVPETRAVLTTKASETLSLQVCVIWSKLHTIGSIYTPSSNKYIVGRWSISHISKSNIHTSKPISW